jgi:hypothetical protein
MLNGYARRWSIETFFKTLIRTPADGVAREGIPGMTRRVYPPLR